MEAKLEDAIIDANTGADAIQRAPIVDYNTGRKCLRIGDISNHRKYNEWGYTEINEENYKKYKLEKDDILIARTGSTIGINTFIEQDYKSVYNNGLVRLRVDKSKYNSKFIYYVIQTNKFKSYINGIAFGTTGQPNMKINDLLKFKFQYIPLEIQNKIVKILNNLDIKVSLNNNVNDNLYKIMHLKFNKWIESLKEYEIYNLSSIANYKNGLAMQKYRPENETGLPVIKIKEMNSGISPETERCRSNIDPEVIINNGDILFAWSGTLCMSIWDSGKAGLNQHIFKVTSEKYPKWFYYFWTLKHLDKFIQIAAGKATTMGHIKREELDLSEVLIPNSEELDRMNQIMSPMLDKYIENKLENKNLEQLRDTLLPKLMNGEIDLDKIEI